MGSSIPLRSSSLRSGRSVFLGGVGIVLVILSAARLATAQAATAPATSTAKPHHQPLSSKSRSSSGQQSAPVIVTPAPPPLPDWPVNDHANPASITWDSRGLKIEASNSSLQQILHEVSVATGTKVEGLSMDQRVYGAYGPGQARDVLSQLLQGSGYNILLAGDLGHGVPRQLVLTLRHTGAPGTTRPAQDSANADDDIPESNDVEEQQPEPPQPAPPPPTPGQPGFGPNGPIRTPQQVMEEMQQRQLQQQQQQQPQQQDSPPAPQNQ